MDSVCSEKQSVLSLFGITSRVAIEGMGDGRPYLIGEWVSPAPACPWPQSQVGFCLTRGIICFEERPPSTEAKEGLAPLIQKLDILAKSRARAISKIWSNGRSKRLYGKTKTT